jgi:hypothetical protein
MWTPTTRQQHSRPVARYQTDLTDAEWRVIAPHLPEPCATGRPREWPMREIVNGIFYMMRAVTSSSRRAPPAPPRLHGLKVAEINQHCARQKFAHSDHCSEETLMMPTSS